MSGGRATRGTKPDPSPFAQAVADEIRAVAGRRSKSQADVQRATGIGKSNLSLYWRGLRTMDLDELRAICDYLETTPEDVVSAARMTSR